MASCLWVTENVRISAAKKNGGKFDHPLDPFFIADNSDALKGDGKK